MTVFPVSKIKKINEDAYQNATFKKVEKDGCMPVGAYLTKPYVEYIKVDGEFKLPTNHFLRGVVVNDGELKCAQPRDLKVGDMVLIGDCPCEKCGIYRADAFSDDLDGGKMPMFKGSSDAYEKLLAMMKEVKARGGKIAWVLGPAVVFDYDTRNALANLVDAGYVQVLLAGNAMATHDLEGGFLNTALGQNIYTQESVPNGHYNHLDLLNEARHYDSLKAFIDSGKVKDGFIKKLVEKEMPIVLCGSIRDDGPLPEVRHNVTCGLNAMHDAVKDADIIITLATLLHSVSATEVAPLYRVKGDEIYGTYICSIDISDYATNSVVNEREGQLVDSIVTNVQDFCVNVRNALVEE